MSGVEEAKLETVTVTVLPDGRMNAKNAARYLGLSEKTLAMMRTRGNGPRFIKLGLVFYYKDDLDAWLGARSRVVSTAEATLAAR